MSPLCNPHVRTIVARLIAAAMLLFVLSLFLLQRSGCGRTGGGSKMSTSSSLTELLGKLPNLQPFGIESCDYAIESSTKRSLVPSPSDIRVELKGSAKLSNSSFEAMKSKFTWVAISRDKVPKGLADIAPLGDLLYSQKLNESFEDNPTFVHGFVIVPSQDEVKKIYFLSTNIDHPIR